MPIQNWNDPDEDAAYRQRANASWDRIMAARRTATQAQAGAVSTMAANYPHMRPGTVLPLAQAGVSPEDPLAQHVAMSEAKNNKKKRGVFGGIGDFVSGVAHIPASIGQFAVNEALNPLGGAVLGVARPALRTGLAAAMAPLEVGTGVLRNVAAAGGNIVAGAASGAAVGAGVGGIFGGIGAIPGALGGAVVGGVAGGVAEMRGVEIESEGFVNPLSQSTLVQSFGEAGLGKGYLPGGTAASAAAAAARRSAAISGHALTPGRFIASAVVEPGTTPYNMLSGLMDTAVSWKLDPSAAAGGKVSKWRKAQQSFVPTTKALTKTGKLAGRVLDDAPEVLDDAAKLNAGLVTSTRRTVIGEKVNDWLGSKQGLRSKEWLADQTDFEVIRNQLGGRKVDVGVVQDLTNATTVDEVDAILRPVLGIDPGLTMKPKVGTKGLEFRRGLRQKIGGDSRMFADLPSGRLDYSNPTEAVDQFALLLRDANIKGEELSRATQEFAGSLLEGTFAGRRRADTIVYEKFLGGAGGQIAKSQAAAGLMRKVARRAAASDGEVLRALIDEDATATASTRMISNGETVGLPTAGTLMSYLDKGFDIDRKTLRDIRSVTSRYARVFDNEGIKLGTTALDHFTNDLWKPTALLRGAWTVRVVGEEQVRLAASGLNSMFNHPLSYMAWMMADDGKIAGIFKKFGVDVGGRGLVDIAGERFTREGTTIVSAGDELEAALRGQGADELHSALGIKQQAEGWYDGNFIKAKHQARYVRGEQGHAEAVAEQIELLHNDPVIRRLASDHPENVRNWFLSGEGRELREAAVKNHGAPLASMAEVERHIGAARKSMLKAIGGEYIPPGAKGHLGAARPGSAALQDAIGTGQLNGVPIRSAKGTLNKDFLAEIKKMGDELPDEVTGSAIHTADWDARRDRAVQGLFAKLMSRPSARLSRSPAFRQTYWNEAGNIITEIDPAAQQRLLDAARQAKLPQAQIDDLTKRAKASQGNLSTAEANTLLKGRALDATQDLLYDAARRGQLSDALRIVMPFAEAQKEVGKVWARLIIENPAIPRRGQQIIGAARGSGAFYTDPTTGEEMFTFPGSELLTEKTIGIPVPLTGRVQGLNVFGSGIIPGMGPAVQMTARTLLAEKPQFEELAKFIDPVGSQSESPAGIQDVFTPAWAKTALKAFANDPGSDRVFANAVKDIWAVGVSTGKYSADTPDDIREGMEDATFRARGLYFIRGVMSVTGVAPTSLSAVFKAKDEDGKWHIVDKLRNDLQAYMDEDPDTANARFLEKYGNNAFAFLQSKSYATTASTPTSPEAGDWLEAHPGITKKYGDVAGFFAPQGEEYDYGTYLRNIRSGATKSLTPEEYAKAANDKLGKMAYYNAKDRFGPAPSKEQRAWLTDLRQLLREEFPGFDVHLPGKPDQETVKNQFIPQIVEAVNDPKLADNEVAQATRLYLAGRQKAQEAAQAAGYSSFGQAKAAQPLREWLRQLGETIVAEVPDFMPMFERIFEREMTDDEQLAQPA